MTADIVAKTIAPLSDLLGKDQKRHRRSSSQPFRSEEHVEEWELKASDALREEILSSYIPVSEQELARIFSDHDSKDDDSLIESEEADPIPLLDEAVEAPIVQPDAQEQGTEVASAAPTGEKTLGVFSDSRIYSAMIRHELKRHDVTIKHFHHPATFRPEQFELFDSIDAWMVFLSDDYDGDFLDQFLERYDDRPTLFLFEKSQRRRTARNIEQFLAENRLTRVKPVERWTAKHIAKTEDHRGPGVWEPSAGQCPRERNRQTLTTLIRNPD